MLNPLDRKARITEQGGPPTLEFQIIWDTLRRELAALDTAANSFAVPFREVTASGDASTADYLILADATSGALTVTLPEASSATGAAIVVKKIDASVNAVTVEGFGAETIDGAANQVLTAQYDAVTSACNGFEWYII